MRERKDSWAIGAALALFYLSFHSYFYNFDGVACAVAVELGNFKYLVHGNHLAYGVVGWAFFQIWRLLCYRGPALLCLQTLDSLLHAAAAGVFHSALRKLGVKRSVAAACALGLAASYAFWFWALDAQVYPFGTLFLALALREMTAPRPRPARLGVFHGLAVLGHVANVLLAPAIVYSLWVERGPELRRRLLAWAGCAAAVVLPVYAWAGVFCVRPRSFADVRVWLLGSAALTPDKRFAWHGGYSAEQLRRWLMTCARIFSDYVSLSGGARAVSLALGLAALALAAWGLARALRGHEPRRPAVAAALWLLPYACLFLSWEAITVVYRISDLLPLWLLIALALDRARGGFWAGAGLAAGLGAVNGVFSIAPTTTPASNPAYVEAVWVGRAIPENSWVMATSAGEVYYPYFGHVRPLNMRYWDGRLPALARRLDELSAAGERVFITERTLSDEPWQGWLRGYGLAAFADGPEGRLYEVRRAASPAAGRGRG